MQYLYALINFIFFVSFFYLGFKNSKVANKVFVLYKFDKNYLINNVKFYNYIKGFALMLYSLLYLASTLISLFAYYSIINYAAIITSSALLMYISLLPFLDYLLNKKIGIKIK